MALTLHGIEVNVENTRTDIETGAVLERLDEALALIDRTQPWRLRHLRRDLDYIAVVRFPCRGAYLPDERACVTELTFLARRDISAAPVAASIVHEGMHARIAAMVRDRSVRNPAREERLCRRAELDFGLALPRELGEVVHQEVRRELASCARSNLGEMKNDPLDMCRLARSVCRSSAFTRFGEN